MRDEIGTKEDGQEKIVSIAPSISARDLAREFIHQDAASCGGVEPAKRALARRLGVAPGTIKNMAGGRLKRICADVFARMKAEQIRRLNISLQKAEHELQVSRACGVDPRSIEFLALEAAVEAARKVREGA